jgi:hypothetical protein
VRAQSLKTTAMFAFVLALGGCAEGMPTLGVHVPRAQGTAAQATLSSTVAAATAKTPEADAPAQASEGFALMGDDKLGFFVEFPRGATEARTATDALVWNAKGEGYTYSLTAQRLARGRAGVDEFAAGLFRGCNGELVDRQVVTGYANPLVLFSGLCGDKPTVLYVSLRAERVVALSATRVDKRGVDRASPKFLQTLHFD